MYELLDLMPGARNCVKGYAFLREGERVLIWQDRTGKVDSRVVQAVALACEEVGAEAHVLSSHARVNRLGEPIAPVVLSAMEGADVIITAFDLENADIIPNAHFSRFLQRTGKRCVSLICTTPALLASAWARFPGELVWAIYQKTVERAKRGKDAAFHLTDPNGTDLRGRISFQWGFKEKQPPRGWMFFPAGDMAEHPESPVDGTVVFEHLEGFAGYLREPIRLTVRDHWVTRVEGGEEARWLEALMGRYERGRYFSEIAIGTHPKAPIAEGLQVRAPDTILFRHAGTCHAAVGNWAWIPETDCPLHWDGGCLKPTLRVGGETIIDAGRLLTLDDPAMRELASRFGDPDDLLAEVW
ncbi:MAG: aminopeptidase [Candidatus Tectomicrobia bacterium]|nr:aminopeptidase [Candidatus Tectomicrobia bacterium]